MARSVLGVLTGLNLIKSQDHKTLAADRAHIKTDLTTNRHNVTVIKDLIGNIAESRAHYCRYRNEHVNIDSIKRRHICSAPRIAWNSVGLVGSISQSAVTTEATPRLHNALPRTHLLRALTPGLFQK